MTIFIQISVKSVAKGPIKITHQCFQCDAFTWTNDDNVS